MREERERNYGKGNDDRTEKEREKKKEKKETLPTNSNVNGSLGQCVLSLNTRVRISRQGPRKYEEK